MIIVRLEDTVLTYKSQLLFYINSNEQVEFEIKNTISLNISTPQNEILRYIPNKICIRTI